MYEFSIPVVCSCNFNEYDGFNEAYAFLRAQWTNALRNDDKQLMVLDFSPGSLRKYDT